MAYKDMTVTCRATEDLYLEAGHRCEHAVMASVDVTADKVHCTMVFEAEGTIAAPQVDTSDDRHEDQDWLTDSDDDGDSTPDLLSLDSSTEDSDTGDDEPCHTEDKAQARAHQRSLRQQRLKSWQGYRAARKAQAKDRQGQQETFFHGGKKW